MSRTPRTPPSEIARLRALARGSKDIPAWLEDLKRHTEAVLVAQHEDLTPRMEELLHMDATEHEAEHRMEERERDYRALIMRVWAD